MFTKKGDAAVLAKLGEAPAEYREIGQRLNGLVREDAPSLEPIVRWGLPFYVNDGKDICSDDLRFESSELEVFDLHALS